MLDVQLFGLNAGPQHVTNLVLHVANTLLLFWLLRRMTGAIWRSAFVAALFALHPLHVESVAWISERKDVLSTLFWLLTMWAYTSYARQPQLARRISATLAVVRARPDGEADARDAAVRAAAARRLAARPAVRLGWRRLIVEKLPLRRARRRRRRSSRSSCSCTAAPSRSSARFRWRSRIANALMSVRAVHREDDLAVAAHDFLPVPADDSRLAADCRTIVLVGGTAAAVRLAAASIRYVPVGWLWYVVTLVPVIGLVQVGRQALADRYTYVPFIGLFIIVAWGVPDLLARWPQRRDRRCAASRRPSIVVACASRRRAQVGYWQNSSTLWQHALDVTADNDRAHNGVGVLLGEAGPHGRSGRRISPRRCASIRRLPPRSTISAGRWRRRDRSTTRSRSTARRCASGRTSPRRTTISGWRWRRRASSTKRSSTTTTATRAQAGSRRGPRQPRRRARERGQARRGDRRVSRGTPSEADARRSPQQPRRARWQQGTARRSHRGVSRGAPAQARSRGRAQRPRVRADAAGHVPDAIAEYSQTLRLNPNSAEAHYNRGYALATERRDQRSDRRFHAKPCA